MATFTLLPDRHGTLCVVLEWSPNFTNPVEERTGWPTGLKASEYEELVGKQATSIAPGIYRVVLGPSVFRFVELIHGPSTRPTYYEERPIKKPRGYRKYEYGRWRR